MKRKNKKTLTIILLLFITLGYAYLNSNLKINGTTVIANNTWDVHFENVVPSSNNTATVNVPPVANPIDKVTELTYDITFNKPGDVYEFNVDIVNAGTIDAMINTLTSKIKIGEGEEQELTSSTLPSYLNYHVTYEDDGEIIEKQLLKVNKRETIKVHVEYKMDINNLDLEESVGKHITFSVDLTYQQADKTAVIKSPNNPCIYNGTLVQGATYVNGQYTYRYKKEYDTNIDEDGWSVALTDKNATTPVTTKLCSSINGKPIVSMSYMFGGSKAMSIDLSSFNTSNVVNMQGVFSNTTNIRELDLSGFNTSKVRNMRSMFNGANNLTKLDLSGFDTSNVTDMSCMFENIYYIKELDLSNFNTENATDISWMFANDYNLQKINVSSFDTSNVTNFNGFIYCCPMLGEVDLSNFDLSNLNSSNAINLQDDYSITNFKTPKSLADGNYFVLPKKLYDGDQEYTSVTSELISKELKAKKEATLKVGRDLFNNLFSNLSVSKGYIKHIKRATSLSDNYIVYPYYSYKAFIISDTASSDISQYPVYGWVEEDTLYYYTGANKIYLNEDSQSLFDGFASLLDIELDIFDTSRVTSMYQMFYNVSSITSLDLSHFDTSNVRNMYSLFCNCYNLKNINISTWNTSNVTDMSKMFKYTYQLENLNISNFDTSNVTSIYEMFGYSGIKRLDLSNFDIRKAKPDRFLYGASQLEELKTFKYNYNGTSITFLSISMYEQGSSTPLSMDYSSSYPTETVLKNTPWN